MKIKKKQKLEIKKLKKIKHRKKVGYIKEK
jgi:hypothetical protein